MLVYLEFVTRRPGVELETFHAAVTGGQEGWSGDHADDIAVLNVGRTWRIGPEPEYLTAWYSPHSGLDRLDAWEESFGSGIADAYENPFQEAARIELAGCYRPLLEPTVGTRGRYYAEWFAPLADLDEVTAWYQDRRSRHADAELALLVDRIGALGPHPSGLAVWGVPSWGAVEALVADTDGASAIDVVAASLYADLGKEQL